MSGVLRPALRLVVTLLFSLLAACTTLQPQLPDSLANLAQQIQSGDTAAEATFITELETRYREHERADEWHQALQLTAQGLRVLPDHPKLNTLYQAAESQLATARLYLAWERLIIETREQLNERDLLRSENKLRAASDYRDWQLSRLNERIETSAEQLRQCGLQAMENRQWHYADDCLLLAAHIRGHDFVKQELAQLKQAKAKPSPAIKTNSLQERRLVNAFRQALQQSNLSTAHATLARLQQLQATDTDLKALQQRLTAATDQRIRYLEEQAAEHYRNQEYQLAKENWQSILKLRPSHQEAQERLKRVDKVLQSLEELQSETDKPGNSRTP